MKTGILTAIKNSNLPLEDEPKSKTYAGKEDDTKTSRSNSPTSPDKYTECENNSPSKSSFRLMLGSCTAPPQAFNQNSKVIEGEDSYVSDDSHNKKAQQASAVEAFIQMLTRNWKKVNQQRKKQKELLKK